MFGSGAICILPTSIPTSKKHHRQQDDRTHPMNQKIYIPEGIPFHSLDSPRANIGSTGCCSTKTLPFTPRRADLRQAPVHVQTPCQAPVPCQQARRRRRTRFCVTLSVKTPQGRCEELEEFEILDDFIPDVVRDCVSRVLDFDDQVPPPSPIEIQPFIIPVHIKGRTSVEHVNDLMDALNVYLLTPQLDDKSRQEAFDATTFEIIRVLKSD